eukprot:JZ552789.1.p1 GENE.JZ552789.1~~JZ552789.1.p1  ORF type:complete len:167 (+),score=18.02 JZ552789.1:24-524(+)
MMAKHSVLFVCLGNICRSPMADMVCKHLVKQRGLQSKWHVDSCGTAGYHTGEDMDDRSAATCEAHGVHAHHKARQLHESDFGKFQYILCMDKNNLSDVQKSYNHWCKRNESHPNRPLIKLLGEFDPQNRLIVEDPYYGGVQGFEVNFQQIMRSCNALLDAVESGKI